MATPKKRSTGSAAARTSRARPPTRASTAKPPTKASTAKPPAAKAPESASAIATPQRLAIDEAFVERAELRRGLADNLRALRTDAVAVEDRVTTAFATFDPSGLPAEGVARRNFVPPGVDPAAAMDAVIDRRVTELKAATPRAVMTIRKGGSAGTLIEKVTGGTGTIKLGPLVDFVAERQDSLVAVESSPAIAACVAEREATDVIAAIDATTPAATPGTPATTGNGAIDATEVDEFVDGAVRRQMASASAPESKPVFGRIPNGANADASQAELLETFELRPGPSDVVSYHDFNTLQIAFEHVWTQIFDGELESLGRALYKEYVGLKDFLGYDAPDSTITTIDDLRRLMGEIKDLSQIAQAQLPPSLGGTPAGREEPPKSSDTLGDAARGVGAVATGGLSVLVEWAIREFANLGRKPVLTWDDVDGGKLARGDRITATIEDNVAPPGVVEIVLLTDTQSHIKKIAFQMYIEQSGQFANVAFAVNSDKHIVDRGGVQYFMGSNSFSSGLLPKGMVEFASEETSALDTPGRYVLGKIADRVKDRSRMTFYWTDN